MSSIKYNPSAEDLQSFEDWLAERPEIADMVRAVSPWHCYRLKGNARGHYAIYSYNEAGTLTIMHGSDSFMPGFGVFGIEPGDLVVCDCGKYEHATMEQGAESERRIEVMRKLREMDS